MSVLPTIPSFVNGDTSLIKLQQLAQAVSFLVDHDVGLHPTGHLYKTVTQSITATGAWQSQNINLTAWLSDPTYVSPGFTIQTQGYYSVEGHLGFESTSGANGYYARLLLTAGSNNPLGNGVTVAFGERGGEAVQTASEDTDICCSALAPTCLYQGDQIAIQAFAATTVTTINKNQNTNYLSGRFVPNLTCTWIRTGP